MEQVHGRLRELASLFLKLGTTAFGGPAAHIAMMEDEVVRRRQWMTREAFLDYLGATNLIPGPNSTELAIHVGHARAGWPGLIVAGVSFIVPATLLVGVTAWAYVKYGSLPAVAGVLYGVKPVVVAVVVQALWSLGRTAMKSRWLAAIGVMAAAAVASGLNELLVLAGAGVLAAAAGSMRRRRGARSICAAGACAAGTLTPAPLRAAAGVAASSGAVAAGVAASAAATVPFAVWSLFLIFLKIGSVLFGSGYVLLAFLRADFVERLGWLTEAQLLDAVAVGQVTPGPVFTTATFIGYLLGGTAGAAAATAGIFLPAFIFVALSGPLVPRIRKSAVAGAVLDGVNLASLALMAVVTWHLGRSSLVDLPTIAMAAAAGIAIMRYRVNSAWVVLAGALLGWGLV